MIQYDFNGRTAVVTGGAKGIGLGIAQRLAGAGAAVAVWDLNPDSLRSSKDGHAFDAIFSVDVTEPASVEQAVQDTLAQLGVIDILVNNAGIAGPTLSTWEYPLQDWDRVIATDLTSVFLCCRAVIPFMLEQGGGRIVNIASVAGKEGNANASAYSAAKAGVIGLTKSLGKELAQSGIIVNLRCPGDGTDRPPRRDDAGVHRHRNRQDPDGPLRNDSGKTPTWSHGCAATRAALPRVQYSMYPADARPIDLPENSPDWPQN